MRSSLERHSFRGINRKAQLKPKSWTEADGRTLVTSALLVMKWGGELTPAGRTQSEILGERLRRQVYVPYTHNDDHGAGLLRLHSTFRHDFKIYASDEGRVMMSAAAFTKGLLALEGSLTPILVSLVHRDVGMLDDAHEADEVLAAAKAAVKQLLCAEGEFTAEEGAAKAEAIVGEALQESALAPLAVIGSPGQKLRLAHQLIGEVIDQLRLIVSDRIKKKVSMEVGGAVVEPDMNTYNDEKISLVFGRWSKLHKEFHKEGKGFDMSKIPDLYDCVKYDAIHNGNLKLAAAPALFLVAKQLADFVIPQEYGTTSEAKHDIARRIGGSMFQLIAHHVRFTIITIPGAYASAVDRGSLKAGFRCAGPLGLPERHLGQGPDAVGADVGRPSGEARAAGLGGKAEAGLNT